MEADIYYVVNAELGVTTRILRELKKSFPEDSEVKTLVYFDSVSATSLDEEAMRFDVQHVNRPPVFTPFNGNLDSVRKAIQSGFRDKILYENVIGETQ